MDYLTSAFQTPSNRSDRSDHSEVASNDLTHIQHCEKCRDKYQRNEIAKLKFVKIRKEEDLGKKIVFLYFLSITKKTNRNCVFFQSFCAKKPKLMKRF